MDSYKINGPCNRSRPYLGILIMAVLMFGLLTIYQLQNTNAQFQSDTVYHNLMSDNKSLNQWEASSATMSSPSNFSEGLRQDNSRSNNR
jgi:uncharacterized membrane protein required for colicin V production